MSTLFAILGALMLFVGTLFLLLGGLGLFRMPDTFTRIQSGTKATTLGTLLVLLGAALLMPFWSIKLVLIMFFVLFTNPLSSQYLARAAHRAKIPFRAHTDHLAEDGEDLA